MTTAGICLAACLMITEYSQDFTFCTMEAYVANLFLARRKKNMNRRLRFAVRKCPTCPSMEEKKVFEENCQLLYSVISICSAFFFGKSSSLKLGSTCLSLFSGVDKSAAYGLVLLFLITRYQFFILYSALEKGCNQSDCIWAAS